MKKQETFDCVMYKRAVQAKHAAANRGLSGEEKMRRRAQWLEDSDNPAARLWRELAASETAGLRE